jgi:Tol biopolymer transport system component
MFAQIFAGYYSLCHAFVVLALSILPLASSPVQAAPVEISGAEPATGLFQISPDSLYVVYAANQALGESFAQLLSAPLRGGPPVQLNLAPPGERIFGYAISAGGSHVVYQSDAGLYSVPIAGPASAGVRLDQGTPAAGGQSRFAISPDGRRVVHQAHDDLYSVAIEGPAGAGVKLNLAPLRPDPGLPGATAAGFAFTPDSQRVLYVAAPDASAFGLYSTPVDGPAGAGVLLSNATPGADIDGFTASSDSQRVVYLSDQATDMIFELYSAPVAGPAGHSARLNVALEEGESVYGFAVSPDAMRVVYVKGYALYSAPIAGPAGDGVRLNTQETAARIDAFAISADSQWVAFQAGDLYLAPILGPADAVTRLTGMAAAGRAAGQFVISADVQRVVYSGYENAAGPLELYSTPLQGPIDAAVKLNRPLATAEQPLFFQISPDSRSVVYEAYQDAAQQNALYAAPLAGPASAGVRLSAEAQGHGVFPLHWQISKDSAWLVYHTDGDLFAAELDALPWMLVDHALNPLELIHTYLPFMQHEDEPGSAREGE